MSQTIIAYIMVIQRRIPVFCSHVWGTILMRISRSYPEMENMEILQDFYKTGRPAMFVANHCSWMDIPFLGATVGWRNYKLISKKELGAIPILGSSIKTGGHIMIDRTNRRSQLMTLKQGINYLKVRLQNQRTVIVSFSVADKCLNVVFSSYRMGRMEFTFVPSPRELDPALVDSSHSKMEPSKWHTRLKHLSSRCRSLIRTKLCLLVGCSR